MTAYLIRRLLLLPLTLLSIVLVNFVIINLAPGEPTTVTEVSADGEASRRADQAFAFGNDDRYLQFREHYGLTLPIIFNNWSSISRQTVRENLRTLAEDKAIMVVSDYDALRIRTGDQARFVMGHLLAILSDPNEQPAIRTMAYRYFVRGGTRQAFVGPRLSSEQKAVNREIGEESRFLSQQSWENAAPLAEWYKKHEERFKVAGWEKVRVSLLETRFARYFSRVLTLDFGTLRNNSNQTVITEVTKRFKYSLTLAFLPMIISFGLCQLFGFTMALTQNRWQDVSLNVVFLVLYATPVFVVAPFLIEKVAVNSTFPFTDIPIPISGFTSSEAQYAQMTSWQRLWDILQHISLPLFAIMYGGLASDSRLSRTAILEVMRQDYVRTARAKGLGWPTILVKHVGRNAGITIVTAIAGSLGVVLSGSLIIETIFEINGFGRFFYEAVVNRDYNVIMFSTLVGSFLGLVGYLIADIAYTLLDPRVTLE